MLSPMGIHIFYIYQVGWYVFATVISFLAALLFWNKGEALANGKVPEGNVTYKLTGAGAIFAIVLLLFYWINPLKPLSDYKKILIIYGNATAQESDAANPITYKIELSKIEGNLAKLNANDVAIEMTPFNAIYSLSPTLDDINTFKTPEKIPPGNYRVRITQKGSGESYTYQIDVP